MLESWFSFAKYKGPIVPTDSATGGNYLIKRDRCPRMSAGSLWLVCTC